jgi:O-antigen/teichoic acid export membrane protein
MAGLGVSLGSSMLGGIAVARLLGAAGFGEVAIVRTTLTMLGVFAGANLAPGVSRFVGQYHVTDPARTARGIRVLLIASLATGGLIAAVSAFFAPAVSRNIAGAPQLAGAIAIGSLFIVFTTAGAVQTGVLFGLRAFRAAAATAAADGIVAAAALVAGAYAAGLTGAIAGMTMSAALTCGVRQLVLMALLRAEGISAHGAAGTADLSVLWAHGLPAVFYGISTQPAEWCARVLLARGPNGLAELGVFAAAYAWGQIALLVPTQLNRPALPMMAALTDPADEPAFQRLFRHTRRVAALSAAVVALPLIAASPWIMRAYGAGFSRGAAVLSLTGVTAIVGSFWASTRAARLAREDPWLQVRYGVLWAAALLGTFVLFRPLGALGLAVAYFCAFVTIVAAEAALSRSGRASR